MDTNLDLHGHELWHVHGSASWPHPTFPIKTMDIFEPTLCNNSASTKVYTCALSTISPTLECIEDDLLQEDAWR